MIFSFYGIFVSVGTVFSFFAVSVLTRVKEFRVFPLILVVMQRPEVDNDSSPSFNSEVSNTARHGKSHIRESSPAINTFPLGHSFRSM